MNIKPVPLDTHSNLQQRIIDGVCETWMYSIEWDALFVRWDVVVEDTGKQKTTGAHPSKHRCRNIDDPIITRLRRDAVEVLRRD